MQRTGSIMTALFFILLLGLSAYAAEKTLGFYKSLFERETSKIEAADRTARKTALSTYGKNLAEAKEALQNRGDLDGTIAANDEIKRFEKEKTGPPPALDGYPPLLVRIQKEYQDALLAVERGTSKNTLDLIKRYLVPLEGLKKGLVQLGQIAEAQKVAVEIKRVTFISGAIAAAQPAEDPSPIKPPEEPSTRLSASIRQGLVLHYSFDKDENGKVFDRSRRKHHGALAGSVSYEGSIKGKGIKTSSKDTYVICDSSDLKLDGWRHLTVSAWVKLSRYATYGHLVNRGKEGTGGAFSLSVGGVYGGKPYDCGFSVMLGQKTSVRVKVKRFADLSRWYHVAGVYDGRTVKYYVDSKEVGSEDVPEELRNKPIKEDSGMDLIIGKSATRRSWHDTHINGMIDEVMIFDHALPDTRIRQIYNSQK
jgi:hypothetical protein